MFESRREVDHSKPANTLGDLVILNKDTLEEVQKIPIYGYTLDPEGKIRVIDKDGYLVIYDANFQEVAQDLEKRKVARLAQGLTADLFRKKTTVPPKVEVEQFQHLVPVKTDMETQFNAQLQTTATLEDISNIREALGKLRTRLAGERLPPDQISFITQGIEDSIRVREHVLAAPMVNEGLTALNLKLASGNLTTALVSEVKGDVTKLKSLEGLVDDATRAQIRALESQFGQQSAELFRTQGAVIEKDVSDLVAGVRNELGQMVSMPVFADWQEFRLPQLVSRLGSLANDCPLEASEIQKKILDARRQLQELSRDYETRFKENYALVREKASEIMGERVELMKVDMDSFVERVRARGFRERSQAEAYISSSEALGVLKTEIAELQRQNPDAAKELDRTLKVQIANIMAEIERGGLTTIAETGQQMELFGRTLFPKWEGHVKEKTQKKVSLIFMPNVRSEGPGVSADQIYGDVGLAVINSRGEMEKIRLYEGWDKEDIVRYGVGGLIPPSYVTHAEFDKTRG